MKKDNKFKIVIPSYNNAEWVEPNLASILNQTYTNYEVLYIDDASTDDTFKLVDSIVGDNPKFQIRRNPKNMKRGYNTAPKVLEDFFDDGEDILVYVDGDDWLAYPDTLEKINNFYNQKDPWMTYGKMTVWKGNEDYSWPFPQNSEYPQKVHQQNAYRKDLWRASHLRTFKWHLYKQIKTESLQYTATNKYYLHAEDLAGSFPCLEMCPPEKIGIVDFLTYVFNESKSNQIRSKERIKLAGQKDENNGITDMEIEIRNQIPYPVISLPFNSQHLFKWNRFDLPIKKLFLKFFDKNINSNFGEEIYKEHLKLWNGFKEYNNPNKNTFKAFKDDFINIFKDIKNNNFNWDKSPIIVDKNKFLLNGSHRTAASSYLNLPSKFQEGQNGKDGQKVCDYKMFKDLNLNEKYMDASALELVRNNKNLLLVSIFPSATHSRNLVDGILLKYSNIAYKKDISLNLNGAFNYTLQLYKGEEWAGNWNNNFAGFRDKTNLCFTNPNPMTVYLVEIDDLSLARQIKEEIRAIYKIGNHSVHINDTYEETLRLSRCLFNENSIHFLNNAKIKNNPKFQLQLNNYEKYLKNNNLDIEDYCITSDSVLSMYGLKDNSNLEYFHNSKIIESNKEIQNYNEQNQYSLHIDDIIYNPKNHFYYNNIKFTSLDIVKPGNKENISVLFLWKNDPRIIDELKSIGQVKETIPVKLSNNGRYNLLDQIHYGKPWWEINLIHETDKRVQNDEFTAYIFTGKNLHEKIKKWKYDTRNKLGLDKTYFHVSDPDCHDHLGQQCECQVSSEEYNIESIRHINMIKHKNTFDFINQRTIRSLPTFDKCLKSYHDWLPTNNDNFCVDNGGILGAYGIRDTHDVDFLSLNGDVQTNSNEFGCENNNHRLEYERLGYSIKDIITNPNNFFYHYGMKFMTLSILKEFKYNRTLTVGEGQHTVRNKDKNDYELINNFN